MDFQLAPNVKTEEDEKEEEDWMPKVAHSPTLKKPTPVPPPPKKKVVLPDLEPPVRLLPPFFFVRIFIVCFLAVCFAASLLMLLLSAYATKKPASSSSSVFPLTTAYRGRSVPEFDFFDTVTTSVALPAMEASFQQHMNGRSCLCAHHLAVPMAMQMCAIQDSLGVLHLMANPRLIGGSNETVRLMESSILACATQRVQTERHRTAIVQWTEPTTQEVRWASFTGSVGICLQLVVDEMNGIKCS
jgi:hypothetical protein